MIRTWRGAVVAFAVAGVAGPLLAQAATAPNRAAAPPPPPPRAAAATAAAAVTPSAPAMLSNGSAVVAIGSGGGAFADSIVSYNLPAMTVKAAYIRPGANFTGNPVAFSSGPPAAAPTGLAGRGPGGGGANAITPDLVAAQTRDGKVLVLNSDLTTLLAMAAPATPIAGRPLGLAAWQDSAGQRWLLAATTASLTAYKVTIANNDVQLAKAWSQSGFSASAMPVVVGNTVLVSSNTAPGGPAKAGAPRGLYAFDARTGSRM